jgi:hypothetical protein
LRTAVHKKKPKAKEEPILELQPAFENELLQEARKNFNLDAFGCSFVGERQG